MAATRFFVFIEHRGIVSLGVPDGNDDIVAAGYARFFGGKVLYSRHLDLNDDGEDGWEEGPAVDRLADYMLDRTDLDIRKAYEGDDLDFKVLDGLRHSLLSSVRRAVQRALEAVSVEEVNSAIAYAVVQSVLDE